MQIAKSILFLSKSFSEATDLVFQVKINILSYLKKELIKNYLKTLGHSGYFNSLAYRLHSV